MGSNLSRNELIMELQDKLCEAVREFQDVKDADDKLCIDAVMSTYNWLVTRVKTAG